MGLVVFEGYWVDDEWGEDPTVVMGAFTSAALGH